MRVSGDQAKAWKAVNLKDCRDIGWQLIEADDQSGEVTYKDRTGTEVKVCYGPHAIRLRPRDRAEYRR